MVEKIIYVAEDSKEFDDEDKCLQYEKQLHKVEGMVFELYDLGGRRLEDDDVTHAYYAKLDFYGYKYFHYLCCLEGCSEPNKEIVDFENWEGNPQEIKYFYYDETSNSRSEQWGLFKDIAEYFEYIKSILGIGK